MTLKEVLLVLGGHVGLLIHSLQEDGYPRHMRGRGEGVEGRASVSRKDMESGDPNPS